MIEAEKKREFFENKSILVTGGTGTIGSEIVNQLLKYNPAVIRIFSNSENELWETSLKFKEHSEKIRYLLGDLRDFHRVQRAVKGIDYIFNAAAIKHVPISEYNPMEAVNVNIIGLENVIEAAVKEGVKKIIHISTDKAVNPTTVMGATKMLSERLCISRDLIFTNKLSISCVRFGNVLGSRGSIIPLIKKQIDSDREVTLTSEKMNRFFMSIQQAVNLVLESIMISNGGEVFVLKMPVANIKDLIEVIIEEYCKKINIDSSQIKIKTIGPREGEKLNEYLISEIEEDYCTELDEMYIIYPQLHNSKIKQPIEKRLGKPVEKDFIYSTESVKTLSKEELKKILLDLDLI